MIKVLTAEDSNLVRKLLLYSLEAAGFEVVAAEDGLDALKKAQLESFDLVITDINMPLMDGIELVSKLRSLPEYQSIPIVALTTDAGDEMKKVGRESGFTGWIVKPFTPEQLVSAINRVLS